jgi:hypothetical protein
MIVRKHQRGLAGFHEAVISRLQGSRGGRFAVRRTRGDITAAAQKCPFLEPEHGALRGTLARTRSSAHSNPVSPTVEVLVRGGFGEMPSRLCGYAKGFDSRGYSTSVASTATPSGREAAYLASGR